MLEALTAPPLLDANPITSPVGWLVGAVGSYVQGLNLRQDVMDPLRLLVPLSHPRDPMAALAADPIAKVVPGCGGAKSCGFQRMATSVRAVGYVLFALVLLARMLKLVAQGQARSPEHVLLDLVPKLLLGLVSIQFFDRALNDAGQLSMGATFLLEDAILLPIRIENTTGIISAFQARTTLGFLTITSLYVLVAYLLLLVVTSRLALLLAALLAPLAIPLAVYGSTGRLASTWLRMVTSGLLIPVVAGIGVAGSMAMAWLVGRVAGDMPFFGSGLAGTTGVCGLLLTAIAATSLFKDVVKQGLQAARGSMEEAHLGGVAAAPGEAVGAMRTGGHVAMGIGRTVAGDVTGALQAARALRGNKDKAGEARPTADVGDGPDSGSPSSSVPQLPGAAPEVAQLPGGPPDVPRLPAGPSDLPRLPAGPDHPEGPEVPPVVAVPEGAGPTAGPAPSPDGSGSVPAGSRAEISGSDGNGARHLAERRAIEWAAHLARSPEEGEGAASGRVPVARGGAGNVVDVDFMERPTQLPARLPGAVES